MSREDHDRLSTADLVAGTDAPQLERPPVWQQDERRQEPRPMEAMPTQATRDRDASMRDTRMQDAARDQDMRMQDDARDQATRAAGDDHPMEQLAALFPPQVAADFHARWDQVQIGFVDDPRQAVQQADELVAQVMKSLASSFAEQRARLEAGLGKGEEANTENLRMALRGYRSFFQRLLSL